MAKTGYSRSPKLQKGALVQLVEGLGPPLPNIIPFQYNPESMTRTLTPWNPFDSGDSGRGMLAPQSQPYDPEESISLALELDASDDMGDKALIPTKFGVADRIAALEKLLLPENTPLGAAVAAISSLLGGGGKEPPKRPSVAVTLFVWGLGRILPVRIKTFSVEEQHFLPSLFPTHAKVSMEMVVVSPESFRCTSGLAVDLAKAVYELHSKTRTALSIAHIANTADELTSILPSELRSLLPF
ncbi:MAG: hypothetical protein QM784_22575 [Polyangiaceae bacterium]